MLWKGSLLGGLKKPQAAAGLGVHPHRLPAPDDRANATCELFTNLIGNARSKYNRPGSHGFGVNLSGQTARWWRVQDNGVEGIRRTPWTTFFELYRVDQGRSHQAGGRTVRIVHCEAHIIRLLHGTDPMWSQAGRGSEFVVTRCRWTEFGERSGRTVKREDYACLGGISPARDRPPASLSAWSPRTCSPVQNREALSAPARIALRTAPKSTLHQMAVRRWSGTRRFPCISGQNPSFCRSSSKAGRQIHLRLG